MSESIDAELVDEQPESFLSPLYHFNINMLTPSWYRNFSVRKLAYSLSVLYLAWMFAKHGVKALLVTEKYIPVVSVIFPTGWSSAVLMLVGVIDVTIACLLLVRNRPWVLLYAGIYPFAPLILSYVATGELELVGKIIIQVVAILALFTAPAEMNFFYKIKQHEAYTAKRNTILGSLILLGPSAIVGIVYLLPNSMDFGILVSFLMFLSFFAAVGLASMFVKKDTTDDYLVAGRGMHPALAALSAVSTWNSGYMFIGFIGFIYLMGYSAIWIGVISTIGQFVAWAWLYKFIQKEGNERGLRSLSSLVAEKAGAPEAKLAAVLSVFFLAIYAAAQLTAGGKALFVMLNWPELVGILIGFVLVVAYCYAGGIRASIWTDAAQSCVMIVGSVILCWVALGNVGGFSGMHENLESQSATLVNFLPTDISLGISLYFVAFFLGGLGVAGQPQVVSRVMTLKSDKDRKQAMIWFFVWQTPFIALMFIVGLASRVLFTDGDFDAELGLPALAMDTLPALGVGMILASIFAATMSTADSQVLACTAAITDDIKPEWREDHKTTKKVTLYVAAAATLISIAGLYIPGGDSVFTLVVLAVYGLGGIFVPLLIIRWMGYKPDSFHSIVMMISAFTGVIIWTLLGLGEDVFPSVPGVGAAFTSHIVMCLMRNDSASNPFGRFEITQEHRKKFTTFGVIALCFVGVAEASYAIYAPDSTEDGFSDEIRMYTIGNWSFTTLEIASGSQEIASGSSIQVTADYAGADGRPIGYEFTATHSDNEQACDFTASTIDDDVSIEGGIGEYLISRTDSDDTITDGAIWINTSLLEADSMPIAISEAQIIAGLAPGDIGLGEYSFELGVTANSDGGVICQNNDDSEIVDWKIEIVFLDSFSTSYTTG